MLKSTFPQSALAKYLFLIFIFFLDFLRSLQAQETTSGKDKIVFSAGLLAQEAYSSHSIERDLHLGGSFSGGAELSVSWRRDLKPNWEGRLGLGSSITFMRGSVFTDFESTCKFWTGQYKNIFLDAGFSSRTPFFNGAVGIYYGYRLNYPIPERHGALSGLPFTLLLSRPESTLIRGRFIPSCWVQNLNSNPASREGMYGLGCMVCLDFLSRPINLFLGSYSMNQLWRMNLVRWRESLFRWG